MDVTTLPIFRSYTRQQIYISFVIDALIVLVTWLYISRRPKSAFRRSGPSPGFLGWNAQKARKIFAQDGMRILKEGYDADPETPFVVQTGDSERLILPLRYLEELKNLQDPVASHRQTLIDRHQGYYTGVDTLRHSLIVKELCAINLTGNLGKILPAMADEVEYGLGVWLSGSSRNEPLKVNASSFASSMITRVTSRVFVGLDLCRSDVWLSNTHSYPMSAVALGRALWKFPAFLRPVVLPFLEQTANLRKTKNIVSQQLVAEIAGRRAGKYNEKPNDMLQWMLDQAKGPDAHEDEIVKKFMVLTLAAVYTSGMTLTHLLYDMCSRPEWISVLREDVEAALTEEKGEWNARTLLRMRKLDSFLKESFNHNQPSSLPFNRYFHTTHRLSDGVVIPAGTTVNIAGVGINPSLSHSSLLSSFEPMRFFDKETETPAKGNAQAFTSLSPQNLSFGYGRQSCPGRFYSAAQIKLITAKILLGWDISLEGATEGKTPSRPANIRVEERMMPARDGIFVFQRRT